MVSSFVLTSHHAIAAHMDIKLLLTICCLISPIKCQMEPFIVGGQVAKITKFPHSGFLSIFCHYMGSGEMDTWTCGSSILNSQVVLTAAHCLWGCSQKSKGFVVVGSASINEGMKNAFSVKSFIMHEAYIDSRNDFDLGLVFVKRAFVFGPTVKRIALMREPPYYLPAQVAGWGYITVSFLQVFTKNILFFCMLPGFTRQIIW